MRLPNGSGSSASSWSDWKSARPDALAGTRYQPRATISVAMVHAHEHEAMTYDRAFAIGVGLNGIFVVVEIAFGVAAGSLALIADAGHNLSDVLALVLAWGALALTRRTPTERRTYGFRRSSILAALANSLILLFVIGGVTWEAVRRFAEPASVQGGQMMIVAAIGVVINGATALLFLSG